MADVCASKQVQRPHHVQANPCVHQMLAAWLQEDVEEMCKYCEKPLIFPLSNPSSKAEITADKAYEWSHGKCVYASGEAYHDRLSEDNCIKPCKTPSCPSFKRALLKLLVSYCCLSPFRQNPMLARPMTGGVAMIPTPQLGN